MAKGHWQKKWQKDINNPLIQSFNDKFLVVPDGGSWVCCVTLRY